MPYAISHAETHTNDYYGNVEVVLLNVTDVPGAVREDVLKALRDILMPPPHYKKLPNDVVFLACPTPPKSQRVVWV